MGTIVRVLAWAMRSFVLLVAACGSSPDAAAIDASSPDVATTTDFCDGTLHDIGQGVVNGLAVDASGRLLAVGTQTSPSQAMFVRRLLATGELDAFAASVAMGDGHAVAVRADGTIAAGGSLNDKPLVAGFTDAGAATGMVTDTASTDSTTDGLEVQGTSFIASTRTALRRVTNNAYDTGFAVTVDGPAAVSDSGIVVAVRQIDSVVTYRLTPDGAMVAGSNTTVAVPSVFTVGTTLSRGDRIAFLAATSDQRAILGRVEANNTADPIVDLGAMQIRTAVERADGSFLLAAYADGLVVLKPDGTVDRKLALPTNVSLNAVADWNGHPTGAGTLSGGHAFVVCFP